MPEVTQLLADLLSSERQHVPQGKGLEQDRGGWCDPIEHDPQSHLNHEIKKHSLSGSSGSSQANYSKISESGATTCMRLLLKSPQRALVDSQS